MDLLFPGFWKKSTVHLSLVRTRRHAALVHSHRRRSAAALRVAISKCFPARRHVFRFIPFCSELDAVLLDPWIYTRQEKNLCKSVSQISSNPTFITSKEPPGRTAFGE